MQRPFAVWLGTAALAVVLSAPAHAQVSVDYQQLESYASQNAPPQYSDLRPLRSPLVPALASSQTDLNAPVIIAGKPVAIPASPDKKPIALKPLDAWKMPVPARPISLGQVAPILLRAPSVSANKIITQLAKQSPLESENANASPLRLRPPAPKPPMVMLAAVQPVPPAPMAVVDLVPAVQSQIEPASPPPAVLTQVAMANPVPQPVAALDASVHPLNSAQDSLKAEDVVALDLGAVKNEDSQPADNANVSDAPVQKTEASQPTLSPPKAASAPLEKTFADSKFAASKPVGSKSAPRVKTAKASPQFISPLAEGLPADENDTSDRDVSKNVVMAPPPAPPEEKTPEKLVEGDKTKTAEAPPQFMSTLGADAEPEQPAVPAEAPMKTGVLSEPVMAVPTQETAADSAEPAEQQIAKKTPEKQLAKKQSTEKKVAEKKVVEKKISVLKDPAPKSTEVIKAEVPENNEPENKLAADEVKEDVKDDVSANDIAWNASPEPQKEKSDAGDSHASADHAADVVAEMVKQPVSDKLPKALSSAPAVVAAAPAAEPSQAPATIEQAESVDMEKLRAQIADANRRAEEAQKSVDELNAKQKISEQKAREEADAAMKLQVETLSKAQENAVAKAQAEAKAEALAKAREEADLAMKAQAEALAKTQAEAIAQAQAEAKAEALAKAREDADARMKIETEALAKAQAEALSKLQSEAAMKAKAEADALVKIRAEEIAKAKAEEMATSQAAELEKIRTEAEARVKAQAEELAKAQAEELAKAQAEELAKAQEEELKKARAEADAANAKLAEQQKQIAKAKPIEHTEITTLPKVVEKLPVREAAIMGTISDAALADTASPTILQTLLFPAGVSVLPAESATTIQQLAQQMKNNPNAKMVINAFADAGGQAGSGARRLSLQRAVLVRDALNRIGVPISRVAVRAQTSDVGSINPDRVEISVE